jgi:hypothetical protein
MAGQKERNRRLQVHVSHDDQRAIEDFRFRKRLLSRSAAIRELLRRGLVTDHREDTSEAEGRAAN